MRKQFPIAAIFFLMALAVVAGCNNDNNNRDAENANTQSTNSGQQAEAVISAVFADTIVNGTARFEDMGDGQVRLRLNITVPAKANQKLAVHIHENGSCADTAKAAGAHWNPTSENHSHWGAAAHHSGDIGNIELDGGGNGLIEIQTDRWTIGGDARTNILNKAIIVHGGVDDYQSQPAGNAGNRIGCGIIAQSGR